MVNIKVLSQEKIVEKGIEFVGDICYSGEYGQQVFDKYMEEGRRRTSN